MKARTIPKIALAITGLMIAGLIVAHLHHRVIVSGKFLGLEIGATKESVAMAISEGNRFSYGELLYCKGMSVTRRNLRDLKKLIEGQVIALSTSRLNVEFEVRNAKVFRVRDGVQDVHSSGQSGQTLTEFANDLADTLRKDRYAVAYSPPYCVERFSSANIQNPEKRKFWENSNIWNIGESDRYTRSRLFFVDNILVEIDFRNYFTELP